MVSDGHKTLANNKKSPANNRRAGARPYAMLQIAEFLFFHSVNYDWPSISLNENAPIPIYC